MKQPWLSVIIPTYNGQKYLAATLDSVVIQQDNNLECIVIDDGSTDNTVAIAESYQDKLPLRIIQRQQGNWVANTNYGMSIAQGTYVCFLHQDDRWQPGRLAAMKSAIARYPQASLYLHPSLFIAPNGERLGVWHCPLGKEKSSRAIAPKKMVEKLLVQNFIAIPAPIFKRQLALEKGGMDEALWYTADWDFWLKLAASGDTVYCPEALAAFRVHGDSQTIRRSSSVADFRQQMNMVVAKHLALWNKKEDSLSPIVESVANFSTEVNTTLAAMIHGESSNLLKLGWDFLRLGTFGWYRYWRDSRIQERVWARLKAKLPAQTPS